jgi:L-ascorbate metabolism protein UlaG (beta-lactamase superfamily)
MDMFIDNKIEKLKPIIKNNKFYNFHKETVLVSLKDVVWHYIVNIFSLSHIYKSRKNFSALPNTLLSDSFVLKLDDALIEDIIIMPLGHACILVYFQGKTILFDPVFKNSSIFLKRYIDPIIIHMLPPIDIVIYSHNHPDHYNRKNLLTILENNPNCKIFGPKGFVKFFEEENINAEVETMSWWENTTWFSGLITITSLPAIHWSQSNMSNRNETLWSSWLVTINEKNIFFAGDTAYNTHFKSILETFKTIDLACIPIAPYKPEEIQIDSHMNIEESYQAFLDLGKPIFIPIHWGVFAYGDEPLKEPILKIIKLFFDNNNFDYLQGTTINYPYVLKDKKD